MLARRKMFDTHRSPLLSSVLTRRHLPQDAWPVGPAGPQKAVQPYLERQAKDMPASQVAQYALAVFRSQLIFSGLYKL